MHDIVWLLARCWANGRRRQWFERSREVADAPDRLVGALCALMRSVNMAVAKAEDLENLLDTLEEVAQSKGAKVSVAEVYEAIGERSFGPLLLVAGLLGMTPVAAIPTAPTLLAVIVLLIAGQLLIGRTTPWLPSFLLKLSISSARLKKALRVTRKPARLVDRITRPRLTFLTTRPAQRLAALACVALAISVPALELLPLVAFVPAAGIFAFALGLVSRDGLVVAAAFLMTLTAMALIGRQFAS